MAESSRISPPASRYALAIDIGGTFTDVVAVDRIAGGSRAAKVLTTHDDPTRGVEEGLARILTAGVPAAEVGRLVHATTLFTNALIERKGARTGLLTTEGFRDSLEIGRERKYELYDLRLRKPRPLVERSWRLEVPERIGPGGEVVTPVDLGAAERAAARLVAEDVESIAVVFLHAYANPEHERGVVEALRRRFPRVHLSASHEVAPEIREYERASTTVANAYVMPLAHRYLDGLSARSRELGIGAELLLMLSSGGLTHLEEAKRTPVRLLESGPAAGAIAAAWFGAQAGYPDLLAFDMGGTTAKLSLIDGGEPLVAYEFEACRERRFIPGSGLPLKISTIELIEIGAGGGSIARIDELGLLKVGPDSAGSEPGPACYGRGGEAATVTDADLLLGYLSAEGFAGGTLAIQVEAAAAALERVAGAAGLDRTRAAWGVHDVVNESMAAAARVHIAERGRDPRRYTLLATGGAGPVHAYYVATKLGIPRLICPPSAGVASALGLLLAPARADGVATVSMRLDAADWEALERTYGELQARALAVLSATGLDPAAASVDRLADMRFAGQAFEIVVPLPPGPYAAASRAPIDAAFRQAYERAFSRIPPGVSPEIVNVRIAAQAAASERGGELPAPTEADGVASGAGDTPEVKGVRAAYFPERGGLVDTSVYDRYRLRPGDRLAGPAIVEERESTLVIGPGGRARVDARGNLIVDLPASRRTPA